MDSYTGVIIEESLEDTSVLRVVKIISTEVEKTTKEHRSVVPQWTMHTVEIPPDAAATIAKKISQVIRRDQSWYADFKNTTHHYIIFRDKVFFIDRHSKEQYDEAKRYGISLGIPEYQVDFHPETAEWQR